MIVSLPTPDGPEMITSRAPGAPKIGAVELPRPGDGLRRGSPSPVEPSCSGSSASLIWQSSPECDDRRRSAPDNSSAWLRRRLSVVLAEGSEDCFQLGRQWRFDADEMAVRGRRQLEAPGM